MNEPQKIFIYWFFKINFSMESLFAFINGIFSVSKSGLILSTKLQIVKKVLHPSEVLS